MRMMNLMNKLKYLIYFVEFKLYCVKLFIYFYWKTILIN